MRCDQSETEQPCDYFIDYSFDYYHIPEWVTERTSASNDTWAWACPEEFFFGGFDKSSLSLEKLWRISQSVTFRHQYCVGNKGVTSNTSVCWFLRTSKGQSVFNGLNGKWQLLDVVSDDSDQGSPATVAEEHLFNDDRLSMDDNVSRIRSKMNSLFYLDSYRWMSSELGHICKQTWSNTTTK